LYKLASLLFIHRPENSNEEIGKDNHTEFIADVKKGERALLSPF